MLVFSTDVTAMVVCGQTISGTVTLTANLVCPAGTALRMSGQGSFLDLNGFTIEGQGTGDIGVEVLAGLSNSPAIANGTIRGFNTCIHAGVLSNIGNLEMVNVDIFDMNLRSCSDAAIRLRNTPIARINRVDIRNSGNGIDAEDANASFVADSYFRNIDHDAVKVVDDIDDVDNTSSSFFVVRNSTIENAKRGVVANEAAILVVDTGITGCSTCEFGIRSDLQDFSNLIGFGGMQAIRTKINKFRRAGIAVTGNFFSATVSIEESIIKNIGGDPSQTFGGIIFDRLVFPAIVSSKIVNVRDGFGIGVYCSLESAIRSNEVRDADFHGILVSEQSGPGLCDFGQNHGAHFIDGNESSDNGFDGISVFADSRHRILNNTTTRNAGAGIVLVLGSDHTVEGNNAFGNGLSGFHIFDATDSILQNNTAKANGNDGFELVIGISTTLTGNLSSKNIDWGFQTTAPVTDGGGNQAKKNGTGQCNPAHMSC
jgi:parallel beta-helix repeat protein